MPVASVLNCGDSFADQRLRRVTVGVCWAAACDPLIQVRGNRMDVGIARLGDSTGELPGLAGDARSAL